MKHKQLYHILDYGKKRSGICYKKMRKKYKHAVFIQIAIQLLLLINTFPTWCIVNREIDPLAYGHSYLDERALCPGGALPRVTRKLFILSNRL